MARGRKITIHLADGVPTGIRHAELLNWTGQAIVCPRNRVSELGDWPQSRRPGVYFLLGEDPTDSKPMAYIGEADDVFARLPGHTTGSNAKDFWDQVVFFSSKDDTVTKAHVKYLESRTYELALAAGRVKLENSNRPQQPNLPRADREVMEDFLDLAPILLGALGFNLLQPITSKSGSAQHADGVGTSAAATSAPDLAPVATLYYKVHISGVDATGTETDEGFVVFKGSVGSKEAQEYLNPGWSDYRRDLIEDGSIDDKGAKAMFTKDVLFRSPSAAAAIVAGGNRNGREVWKNAQGKSLKQLEAELLASSQPAPLAGAVVTGTNG